MSFIKICGVTRQEDLDAVIAAGATAVGFNLWPRSPRAVAEARARELCERARGRIETVLVVVDHPGPDALRMRVGADWLQLHGDEPPEAVGDRAFKAIGLAGRTDVARASAFPGDRILVDARDPTLRGGTGREAPRELARTLARRRRTILAGGLGPENVASAIAAVSPWGVDTASGVEFAPGVKDPDRIAAFVNAAREAFQTES